MDHFCYCCFVFVMLFCLFNAALWSPAILLCFVICPCGVLGRVWYFIVSIPDLCLLTYFKKVTVNVANNHYGKTWRRSDFTLSFLNICQRRENTEKKRLSRKDAFMSGK